MMRTPIVAIACGIALSALTVLAGGAAAQSVDDLDLEPGFTFRVYDVGRPLDRLAPIGPGQTPNVDERRSVIDFRAAADFGGLRDRFAVEILGYLIVRASGEYAFRLTSDDGARLTIDDTGVVEHDGVHPATAREGTVVLEPGLRPFRVQMFENGGGEVLTLEWRPPGAGSFVVVPAEAFGIERGVTRVVSPGQKTYLDGREHLKPGDGMPLDAVHPGWAVDDLRPEGFEPQVGGMAFLPDGRLVLSSFRPVNNGVLRTEPNGTLWVLDHVLHDDDAPVTVERIADGFHDPAGVAVVDGAIYVCHRTDVTRLRDDDGDGTFESREVFASGWMSDNYHHFTFGLLPHDDDAGRWLYGSLSTSIYFNNTIESDNVVGSVVSMNGPNPAHRGTVFRVNLETRDIEYLAGGFRTPNGLGHGPDGTILVMDNQGAWLPASKVVAVEPGRFYGHYNGGSDQRSDRYPGGGTPSLHDGEPVTSPTLWLPQNECANSPTEALRIPSGPFAGQVLMGELTMGGIRRLDLEKVEGEWQGAAFRFTQGLECGVNRMAWGPDGCLYVGGTGADGNWSWRNTRFGLQRLRPTDGSAFEFESMRATADGFLVSFTREIDAAWLADPAHYQVTQWHYRPTAQYGGPKHGVQRVAARSAVPAADGRSVRLVLPSLREGNVVHLHCAPTSIDGAAMWSTEAWYTLNRKPRGTQARAVHEPLATGDLTAFRAPTGDWLVAGDAAAPDDAPTRLVGRAGAPEGGRPAVAINGTEGRTRHLVTEFEHGDAELHVEFMVPKGSNSGVYFQGRYEIQVLDSWGVEEPQHSDCGGVYQRWDPGRGAGREGYEGRPPRRNAARPPGAWQSFDVVFRAPRFDAHGNKVENARFERVVHNGVVVHENVELSGPTRAALFGDEAAYGPLMMQGDHGPVAYRNLRLRVP